VDAKCKRYNWARWNVWSQPWHFIAIQDKTILKSLSETGANAGHLAGAALGVAIITPPMEKRFSILFDAGQAAAFMQLAAWELGIGSCPATIYQPEEARALLSERKEAGVPLDQYTVRDLVRYYCENANDVTVARNLVFECVAANVPVHPKAVKFVIYFSKTSQWR